MNEDEMNIYKFLDYGFIIQGHHCSGSGKTRNEAINNWLKCVKQTMSPGGWYLKQARPIAKRLKENIRN